MPLQYKNHKMHLEDCLHFYHKIEFPYEFDTMLQFLQELMRLAESIIKCNTIINSEGTTKFEELTMSWNITPLISDKNEDQRWQTDRKQKKKL